MDYGQGSAEQEAREILAAARSLRTMLSRSLVEPAQPTSVTVKVTAQAEDKASVEVGAHEVIVTIAGERSHVEALGAQFADAGCGCVSVASGDPDLEIQECDCSNLPD